MAMGSVMTMSLTLASFPMLEPCSYCASVGCWFCHLYFCGC
jgi:hypothetical protein